MTDEFEPYPLYEPMGRGYSGFFYDVESGIIQADQLPDASASSARADDPISVVHEFMHWAQHHFTTVGVFASCLRMLRTSTAYLGIRNSKNLEEIAQSALNGSSREPLMRFNEGEFLHELANLQSKGDGSAKRWDALWYSLIVGERVYLDHRRNRPTISPDFLAICLFFSLNVAFGSTSAPPLKFAKLDAKELLLVLNRTFSGLEIMEAAATVMELAVVWERDRRVAIERYNNVIKSGYLKPFFYYLDCDGHLSKSEYSDPLRMLPLVHNIAPEFFLIQDLALSPRVIATHEGFDTEQSIVETLPGFRFEVLCNASIKNPNLVRAGAKPIQLRARAEELRSFCGLQFQSMFELELPGSRHERFEGWISRNEVLQGMPTSLDVHLFVKRGVVARLSAFGVTGLSDAIQAIFTMKELADTYSMLLPPMAFARGSKRWVANPSIQNARKTPAGENPVFIPFFSEPLINGIFVGRGRVPTTGFDVPDDLLAAMGVQSKETLVRTIISQEGYFGPLPLS